MILLVKLFPWTRRFSLFMQLQVLSLVLLYSSVSMGGSDPLRRSNFKNCESEPFINDVILRCHYTVNFLMIVVPG